MLFLVAWLVASLIAVLVGVGNNVLGARSGRSRVNETGPRRLTRAESVVGAASSMTAPERVSWHVVRAQRDAAYARVQRACDGGFCAGERRGK